MLEKDYDNLLFRVNELEKELIKSKGENTNLKEIKSDYQRKLEYLSKDLEKQKKERIDPSLIDYYKKKIEDMENERH